MITYSSQEVISVSLKCIECSGSNQFVLLHLERLTDSDDALQSTAVVAQHTLSSQHRDLPPADINLRDHTEADQERGGH